MFFFLAGMAAVFPFGQTVKASGVLYYIGRVCEKKPHCPFFPIFTDSLAAKFHSQFAQYVYVIFVGAASIQSNTKGSQNTFTYQQYTESQKIPNWLQQRYKLISTESINFIFFFVRGMCGSQCF